MQAPGRGSGALTYDPGAAVVVTWNVSFSGLSRSVTGRWAGRQRPPAIARARFVVDRAFASVNGFVEVCSGSMATFLSSRVGLLLVQRWAMGVVLVALGAHMTFDALKLGGIY